MPEEKTFTFSFRGKELFDLARARQMADNPHQVSTRAEISYPTVRNYMAGSENTSDKISLSTLYAYLVKGLGFTAVDLDQFTFLDIFALTEDDEILLAHDLRRFAPEKDPIA